MRSRQRPIVTVLFLFWASWTGFLESSARAAPSALTARDKTLLEEIEKLDVEVQRLEIEVTALRQRAEAIETRLQASQIALAPLTAELEERRQHMGARLRLLYRTSERSVLKLLFSSRNHRDLMKRSRYLWFMVTGDMQAVKEHRRVMKEHQKLQSDLEQSRIALQGILKEKEGEELTARLNRTRRQDLLASLSQSGRLPVITNEIMARGDEAVQEILRIPSTALSPTGFPAHRGQMILPALGNISRTFGRYSPEGSSEVLIHRGIDIRAPDGAPVRAIYRGTVQQAEWLRGYGNVVILDHGDGYFTVYAHLASMTVRPGERLLTSQPLGTVGATGSLDGAYLYFEIRYRGTPQDPLDWIQIPRGVRVAGK